MDMLRRLISTIIIIIIIIIIITRTICNLFTSVIWAASRNHRNIGGVVKTPLN